MAATSRLLRDRKFNRLPTAAANDSELSAQFSECADRAPTHKISGLLYRHHCPRVLIAPCSIRLTKRSLNSPANFTIDFHRHPRGHGGDRKWWRFSRVVGSVSNTARARRWDRPG